MRAMAGREGYGCWGADRYIWAWRGSIGLCGWSLDLLGVAGKLRRFVGLSDKGWGVGELEQWGKRGIWVPRGLVDGVTAGSWWASCYASVSRAGDEGLAYSLSLRSDMCVGRKSCPAGVCRSVLKSCPGLGAGQDLGLDRQDPAGQLFYLTHMSDLRCWARRQAAAKMLERTADQTQHVSTATAVCVQTTAIPRVRSLVVLLARRL